VATAYLLTPNRLLWRYLSLLRAICYSLFNDSKTVSTSLSLTHYIFFSQFAVRVCLARCRPCLFSVRARVWYLWFWIFSLLSLVFRFITDRNLVLVHAFSHEHLCSHLVLPPPSHPLRFSTLGSVNNLRYVRLVFRFDLSLLLLDAWFPPGFYLCVLYISCLSCLFSSGHPPLSPSVVYTRILNVISPFRRYSFTFYVYDYDLTIQLV